MTRDHFNREGCLDKLHTSSKAILDIVDAISDWTTAREDLLMRSAEHEVMHEGQIIRHMYGLEKPLPSSFKWA
ncbi:MAG: hypothetical protein QGI68_14800 [Pseudomonadales bacterium]|jgi:hypothetical protein|nr:hypothetical protein [Pseudomonadales bacterium]MDP7357797.1 hypothetical protein [Pseudomonadales bacterium]MDP7596816.1 hypothetical protein [Pseudomonadales bacterium]HJN51194.1 hypothetical protein [Pseudomonadales bacterium]|tara:strand:- start:3 stop:221 length:219 start_codon:yes stop_codon:yes gene_type:complete